MLTRASCPCYSMKNYFNALKRNALKRMSIIERKESRMGIKIVLLIVFFAVMVGVGIYSRRHATSVDGFVLGGRSVGPWFTAFAYGTSYF